MPEIRFDTFYRYDDLTRILHEYAQEHPELVRLESIGKSFEKRDIWLAAVTNWSTGDDKDKPALWVDGNIHAAELTPSNACLFLINRLVTEHKSNPDITRCLDTRVF